ncbi:MAG: hypothetical protein R6V83_13575 [Candidatus Thorarchaeota archaeon]
MISTVNSMNLECSNVMHLLVTTPAPLDYLSYIVYTNRILDDRQGAEILTYDW